ncbi:retrovirus-related pol polyprotein LINE-1 [Tanacetum coccineum]
MTWVEGTPAPLGLLWIGGERHEDVKFAIHGLCIDDSLVINARRRADSFVADMAIIPEQAQLQDMAMQAASPAAAVLPSAQVVGNAFVEQYYHILHQSPELVHKFYQDSSIFSRPNTNGLMTSVTTMQSPHIESRPERSGEVGSSRHQMHYDCYYSRINQGEVRTALQRMGRNKAVGPDQIPIEAWRCLEDEGVKWLTCLFNKIFLSEKMPEEWRLSEVIPIYKNKGDAQACSNYRGIKLFSHTMKLWERVIERRLRRETRVSDGTAYDSVPHELVWRTLRDKGTPRRYSRVIKDMYEGVKTRVRTIIGNTEFFPVDVGLHQGSAISPYLFTLILDELSREIQESIPWCMIFADDIVLIAESAEELNNKIERWREALEDNGLRVSREKTEYLRCDFGRYEVVHQEVDVRIGDRILQPKESFRYLGSVIHRSGRIDEDVAHRIGVGWMKWRAASGVLCDRRIPLKLKGKFYRVAIRPAMLYGSECWPITKAQANRVEVAELRMLRWTCGKTMVDMIPNGVFRAGLDVDSIIDKMREGRLRWFGHVKRRPQNAPVRRVEAMLVEGSRRRGRPKLRWEDRLKQDMMELLLSVDMTSDRNAWRDRIRISG